jgi:hypothetical protein
MKKEEREDRKRLLGLARQLYEPRGYFPYSARKRPHMDIVDVYFHIDENGRGTGPMRLECVTMGLSSLERYEKA